MRDVPHDRQRVAAEMQNEIVGCRFYRFMRHYAPPLIYADVVEDITEHLVEQGLLEELGSGMDMHYVWTDFPVVPSQMTQEHKPRVFKRLEPICKAICGLCPEGNRPTLCYVDGAFQSTASEIGGSTHRMDGTMKLRESLELKQKSKKSTRALTADVAVNLEYKKKDDSDCVSKNRSQLFGGALHIKHNDPTRSHSYSISIEDHYVTVWYWSPSHSTMSDTFNFIEEPHKLIYVLTAFLYASKEELGFDEHIERAVDPDTDQICYLYSMAWPSKKIYKTVECLYEKHTLSFTGRAPRVWVVVEVASRENLTAIGPRRVLKDYWLGEGERTERDIQGAIFADLERISSHILTLPDGESEFAGVQPETAKALRDRLRDGRYKELFLKIEDSCVIGESKEVPTTGVYSATNVLQLFPSERDMEDSALPQSGPSGSSFASAHSEAAAYDRLLERPVNSPPLWAPARPFRPREHHLLLYEEVCTVLHELPTLKDVFAVMMECLLALQLLALAGWIHRDISTGNLLGYMMRKEYRGKLADLEFSKKCDAAIDRLKDPKTGTPFYMAVEILLGRPLIVDTVLGSKSSTSFNANDDDNNNSNGKYNDDHNDDEMFDDSLNDDEGPQPVRHEVVHDAESFFWLVVWFLFLRVNPPDPPTKGRDYASRIFRNGGGCTSARRDFLTDPAVLRKVLQMLHRTLRLKRLMTTFENARASLMQYYFRGFAGTTAPSSGEVIERIRSLLVAARVASRENSQGLAPYNPIPREGHVHEYEDAPPTPPDSAGEEESDALRVDSEEVASLHDIHSTSAQPHPSVFAAIPGSSLGEKRRAEDSDLNSSDDGSFPDTGPRKKVRSTRPGRRASPVSPSPAT